MFGELEEIDRDEATKKLIEDGQVTIVHPEFEAERKRMKTMKKCEVCGELKKPCNLRSTGKHAICYDCAKVAIEEDLLCEDCDGLLYEYTDESKGVNWIKEVNK